MAEPEPAKSNWTKASGEALIDRLVCRFACGAENRVGLHVITIEDGRCVCSNCGHDWPLEAP